MLGEKADADNLALDITRYVPLGEPATVVSDLAGNFSPNVFYQIGKGLVENVDPQTGQPLERKEGGTTMDQFGPLGFEVTERMSFVLRNLFRAYSAAQKEDIARVLGISLTEEKPGSRLYARHAEEMRTTALETKDTRPGASDRYRGALTDEQKEDARIKAMAGIERLIGYNYGRFAYGLDQNNDPLLPYSANTVRLTDEYGIERTATGTQDAYDLLAQAGAHIAGQDGMINMIKSSSTLLEEEKAELLTDWWLAYDENLQWRVGWLMTLAHTTPDPEGAGRGRSSDPNVAARSERAIAQAVSDVRSAMMDIPDLPPDLLLEWHDMYVNLIDYQLTNGYVPDSAYRSPVRWYMNKITSLDEELYKIHGFDPRLPVDYESTTMEEFVPEIMEPFNQPIGAQ